MKTIAFLSLFTLLGFVTKTSALEIDLLSPLAESPLLFNVRTILTPRNTEAYLFGRGINLIRASEQLLQQVINNIESNKEFLIVAHIRIISSSEPGALFSIMHIQKKLHLLDLSTKGTGDKLKLLLRYRSTNGTAETVVFKNVAQLGDGKYHKIVLRITDTTEDDDKKISAVALYVDCKYFGRVDTVSRISSIFSYRGILLSLLEFRIAQRGLGRNVNTKWKGTIEELKFVFKRDIKSILEGPESECIEIGAGVKAPIQPLVAEASVLTAQVAKQLIGLVEDLRYDLSMQVAEIKYLRMLVENCEMCRVQDFCRFKPCFPGVPCFNDPTTHQGFECGECPLGMIGDGVNCTDIDECNEVHPCAEIVFCYNRSPGYWCPPCPPGFSGEEVHGIGLYYAQTNKQVCTDIDECTEGPPRCAKESNCINTLGSYECTECPLGYTGDPRHSCYYLSYCDPDDAKSNPCSQHAKCIRLRDGRSYDCECRTGYAGDGHFCGEDGDLDGYPDRDLNCTDEVCRKDNCLNLKNPGQEDLDKDGIGDVCDDDLDGDNVRNDLDNCPRHPNPTQYNADGDLMGNDCDNCPYVSNLLQGDIDKDGIGDACDIDADGDDVLDSLDNCREIFNPRQDDQDEDTIGDVCDNCPSVQNKRQRTAQKCTNM